MLRILKYQKRMVVIGLCVFNLFATNYAVADVAIIVHPSNTSTFDKSTIKKIFLGKKKSFSNSRIAILLSSPPKSTATEEFNKKVIGKSRNQVNAYWSKMIFTGKGTPPQEMPSTDEIISAIAANPDAIAYIDSSEVTDAVRIVATF
ncbi:MAG: ABC-type phosphate transport system substrate-binding protein [Polaribacter sp.]|jgi:ABC-type phosphate transport system substrate-binding protein